MLLFSSIATHLIVVDPMSRPIFKRNPSEKLVYIKKTQKEQKFLSLSDVINHKNLFLLYHSDIMKINWIFERFC